MLQSKVVRVNFTQHVGSENTKTASCIFPYMIKNPPSACIALNGFDIHYSKGDRPFLRIKIELVGDPSATDPQIRERPIISGLKAVFSVTILLKDNSGNVDDPYEGWVDVLVITEC